MPQLVINQANIRAPSAPAGPRVDPNSFGNPTLQNVGQLLLGMADQERRVRMATDLARARADASTEVARFLTDLSNDPNPEGYEAKSEQFYAQLDERLQGSLDGETYWALGPDLAAMRGQLTTRAIGMREQRSDDRAAGQLQLSLHNLTNLAGSAQTSEEFALYQDQISITVSQAVMGGSIGEAAGVQLLQGSLADTEVLRVSRMIEGAPLRIAAMLDDIGNFPNLTAEQRYTLQTRAQNQYERQVSAANAAAGRADAAAQDAADAVSRDMRLRLAMGEEVSQADIMALAPQLSNTEFNGLLSAWTRTQEGTDPAAADAYIALDGMARGHVPQAVFEDALMDARINDYITNDEYDQLRQRYTEGPSEAPSAYDTNAQAITAGLTAGPIDQLTFTDRATIAARQADALQEYYNLARPDMAPEALQSIRDYLLAKYTPNLAPVAEPQTQGPPLPPAASWTPETVAPDDIAAWARERLAFWAEQLGSEDAAERSPQFQRELTMAAQWAQLANAREPVVAVDEPAAVEPVVAEPVAAEAASIPPPSGNTGAAELPGDALPDEAQRAVEMAVQQAEAEIGAVLVTLPTEWLPRFARYMQGPDFANLPAAHRLAIIQRFSEMTPEEREEFLTDG